MAESVAVSVEVSVAALCMTCAREDAFTGVGVLTGVGGLMAAVSVGALGRQGADAAERDAVDADVEGAAVVCADPDVIVVAPSLTLVVAGGTAHVTSGSSGRDTASVEGEGSGSAVAVVGTVATAGSGGGGIGKGKSTLGIIDDSGCNAGGGTRADGGGKSNAVPGKSSGRAGRGARGTAS